MKKIRQHKTTRNKEKYSFHKALEIIKNNAKKKFLENIDVAINLKISPKKKHTPIKGYALLPYDIKKKYRIAIFVSQSEKEKFKEHQNFILNEEDIKNLKKKKKEIDLIITTPTSVTKMGKINKILNTKNLIPNVKYDTITTDVSKTIKKIKKNYIRFKNERNDIIHSTIGKIDLDILKLKKNLETLLKDIKKQRPKNCKNIFINKINISSTMGANFEINKKSLNIK